MYDGVKLDAEHNLYYFELLEGKTDAAKRKVPVHPKLIEKGVLKISGIVIKAEAITDYINKTRDTLEIPLNDSEDSKRIYHSFRHAFITKGISKGVTVEHLQSVVGHSKKLGITSRYVHRLSLVDLYEVMMKISYDRR
jgi:integrase